MDTRVTYPEIIKKILTEIADSYSQGNEWPVRPLFDDERKSYLLLDNGWNGDKYVHHTPIHIDVIDDKVWIQQDDSQEGVATDLLEAGISKTAIVLGFRPPKVRPYTEFVTG